MAQTPAGDRTAVVTAVSDGDTVWVTQAAERLHVRIYGVDAPEGPQPFGAEAAAFATRMLLGQRVTLVPKGKDQGDRLVAVVTIGGRDFGAMLVGAGYAWHDARFAPRDHRLAQEQQDAREARRGLWSAPAPQAPWDFRRAAPPAQSSVAAAYRGNRNSRVFHAPGCRDYQCPKCTIALDTIDLARAQGFRPHGACVR